MPKKTLAGMVKERVMKNTPIGVIASGIGLLKDVGAKRKSEAALDKSLQDKARRGSKSGQIIKEGGNWVPYQYGK